MSACPTECPSCKANLVGERIPDEISGYYQETHWSRVVLRKSRDSQDKIWECPECKHQWPL
jgi:hypothetical protein